MTAHAWMLMPSGRRLDLLNPHPGDWTDDDLAIRLSRTYRWCSDTRWDRPLSVAQHSLTVLRLRQAASVRPLTPAEQLRELLHDAEEGVTNHDVPTPLKPLLGEAYQLMIERIRRCIDDRYNLPGWDEASYAAHKQADRLAAASEARHVVGWSDADIRLGLDIAARPVLRDPLPPQQGLRPWEPWPAHLAARLFGERLTQLQRNIVNGACVPPPAVLPDAAIPETGPTLVLVEGGGEVIEGRIVGGVRDDDGTWDLDGEFTVLTEEGDRFKVCGWNCITEVL